MIFDIREFGAVADGKTVNTAAIQAAIDECAKVGGRVLVENGVYVTGAVNMRSNVELHIAAGATLLGSPECDDYPEHEDVKHVNSKRLPRWRNASMIFADECENIAITGLGTIDCNGENFIEERKEGGWGWKYIRKLYLPTPPRAVFFTGCKNVNVTDITMINQPAGWSYWIHDCDYVTFDRVKVIANVNYPNNDGIHINSSRNVTISNSSLTCGDDCLIVRANNASLAENKVCERVVVTNCNLTSYSAGIRIAWLNDGVIRNCTFSNIVMTDCTRGISMALPFMEPDFSNPNSADQGREQTLIENLHFSNIVMDAVVRNPIYINIDEREHVGCAGIRNIRFDNMHASGPEFIHLKGRDNCHLENIRFTNCDFTVTDGSEIPNRAEHGADRSDDYSLRPMTIKCVDNLEFINTSFNVSL